MLKVVLDTNIIVSAFHTKDGSPALILSLVLDGQLKPCLSDDIFTEYREVLSRDRFKYLDQVAVRKVLSELKKKALMVCPKTTLDLTKDDPEDNKFLESALEAKADFIITGNAKHFPFKKFRKTHIVTPSEFVQAIAKLIH